MPTMTKAMDDRINPCAENVIRLEPILEEKTIASRTTQGMMRLRPKLWSG
jgi:hypothetical protein